MRRYSPTSTERWSFCPLSRQLHREGWQPSRLGKKELSGILGTAFTNGMAVYHTARQHGQPTSVDACVNAATQTVTQSLAKLDELGFVTPDSESALRNSLAKRAATSVAKYVGGGDPIPPSWVTKHIEHTLPEWGDARIDLGLATPLGPVVLDYKHKITHDDKWLQRDVDDWEVSEQRFLYTEGYGELVGQPVYAFYICLVVAEPKWKATLIPFVTDPVTQTMWRQSRERVTWPLMSQEDSGDLAVGMAAKHRDNFGPCPFKRACFTHKLDPSLMAGDYIKVLREGR